MVKKYYIKYLPFKSNIFFQNSSLHAGDSDSDDDDDDMDDEDDDLFEDAEEGDDDAFNTEKEEAARSLLSLQNPTNSMTNQGLLPNRPKSSAYLGDLQSAPINQSTDQPSSSEDPLLRSEQALVSANTQRAQDLQQVQGESQEPCLNLKQFLPPNTAERYYFSSPAKSENGPVSPTGITTSLSSSTITTSSSPTIWSIARMSVTTTTSSSSARPGFLPLGLGGSVSIYKTSNSVSSTPSLLQLLPNNNGSAQNVIKERSADILSPVTESATVLSFINKTLMVSNGASRMFESESDPPAPALSAYLQERAAVRAANKTTPFNSLNNSASPKNIVISSGDQEMSQVVVSLLPTQAVPTTAAAITVITPLPVQTTTTTPVSLPTAIVKPSFGSVAHHIEDKYAPRNVTMNVKDLPEDVTSNSTSRHPQLPQDIHLAAANALAKGAATAAASSESQPSTSGGDNSASGEPYGQSTSDQTEIFQTNDEGKSVCGICSKVFSKASQLRLHVNIHYFERPFRCDSCAVSFRTKGHLQKHKRSVGHFNKVNINATFGTPTATNPRPFKCVDCKIAFRIHGHLAKHLRSKMHIMKLECSGKLPIGMFAEMERLGTNLNEIDTSDCENSLESLQQIALRLYKQDPSKLVSRDDDMSRNILVGSDASDTEDSEPMVNGGDSVKHETHDGNGCQPILAAVQAPPPPPAVSLTMIPLQNSSSWENLNFSRRASFSSSGHDDHSTDSEAVSFQILTFTTDM